MEFFYDIILRFNQLKKAVLERVTNLTLATLLTVRGQIAFNDDINKIVYHDGTNPQVVASEAYVNSQMSASALTVAPASAPYLRIQAGQIEVRPLLVTRPVIDSVSTSLAAALAARTPVYNATNVGNGTADLQEGDFLILPTHTGGIRVFLHNGGTAGGVGDFTLVEQPSFDSATIRALFTATNGIVYNNATGQFKLGTGNLTESVDYTLDANGNSFSLKNNAGHTLFSATSDGLSVGKFTNGGTFFSTEAPNSPMIFEIGALTEGNALGLSIFDNRTAKMGMTYGADYSAGFTARSLVDKAYVDGSAAKRFTQTVTTVANTFSTITHNFALADKDSVHVSFWLAGKQVAVEVETVDANSIRIRTSSAVTNLKVYISQ